MRCWQLAARDISIHALLAESDKLVRMLNGPHSKFLSTLSLRRATRYGRPIDVQFVFLSTLSLRRATFDTLSALAPEEFLSTLSLRRATVYPGTWSGSILISIHALLAESDRRQIGEALGYVISIHALLAESDSKSAQNSGALLRI